MADLTRALATVAPALLGTRATGEGASLSGSLMSHAFPAEGRYPVTVAVADDEPETAPVSAEFVAIRVVGLADRRSPVGKNVCSFR